MSEPLSNSKRQADVSPRVSLFFFSKMAVQWRRGDNVFVGNSSIVFVDGLVWAWFGSVRLVGLDFNVYGLGLASVFASLWWAPSGNDSLLFRPLNVVGITGGHSK